MSVMDKLKSLLKGHESTADKGIDRAGTTSTSAPGTSTSRRSTPRRTRCGTSSAPGRTGTPLRRRSAGGGIESPPMHSPHDP